MGFIYTGFTPRETFKQKIENGLEELMELFPSDSTGEAEVTRTENGFHFNVVVRSTERTFTAETELNIPIAASSVDRDWQLAGFKELAKIFEEQLQGWRLTRRTYL